MPWSSNACGKRLVQRMKALDGPERAGAPIGNFRLEKIPDVATEKPPLQTGGGRSASRCPPSAAADARHWATDATCDRDWSGAEVSTSSVATARYNCASPVQLRHFRRLPHQAAASALLRSKRASSEQQQLGYSALRELLAGHQFFHVSRIGDQRRQSGALISPALSLQQ
jgi:hypothetical protein